MTHPAGPDGMYEQFFGLRERPFDLTPDPPDSAC